MRLYTTYWRKMRFNDRFEERPEFEGVLKVKISQGASQYDPGREKTSVPAALDGAAAALL
jgi:hypothetical protein